MVEDGRSELARLIGSQARRARLGLKKTQADMAEAVELATEVYGRLERGYMLPSVPTLVRLASALSLTPNDLLKGAVVAVGEMRERRPQRDDLRLIIDRLERVRSSTELRRVRNVINAALGPTDRKASSRPRVERRR